MSSERLRSADWYVKVKFDMVAHGSLQYPL